MAQCHLGTIGEGNGENVVLEAQSEDTYLRCRNETDWQSVPYSLSTLETIVADFSDNLSPFLVTVVEIGDCSLQCGQGCEQWQVGNGKGSVADGRQTSAPDDQRFLACGRIPFKHYFHSCTR